ncbi:hypothetical protein ACFVH6_42905 [Spirillospora sp. NPDC127200]
MDLPPLTLALGRHARYDEDAAHAWLRALVRESVAEAAGTGGPGVGPAG